jgi:DNA-binding transcriptional LysR family regulator
MNITIRQIELFLSLMRNPHIGAVAQEHFLTHSAVSMAIKALEQTVGERLFDRISNRLVPNENGKILMECLEPAFEQIRDVETLFKRDRMAGVLRVGASSTFADYILPQVLYTFKTKYPQSQIEVINFNSEQVVEHVESGEINLGFIEGDYESHSVEFEEIFKEELVVVTADKYMAGLQEYQLSELLDLDWILREQGSGTRQTMWKHLGQSKKDLNIFMELEHMEAIKSVLKNPGTLSCMSPFSFQRELAKGELFPVQLEGIRFKRSLFAVMNRQKYRSNLLNQFVFDVRDHLMQMLPQIASEE